MQSISSGNVERSRNASGSRSSQSLDFRPSRAMRRCWDVPIGSVGHCSEVVPTQPSSRKTSMAAACSVFMRVPFLLSLSPFLPW